MELENAKGLMMELSNRDGYKVTPLNDPFEYWSVSRPAEDDLDNEIWRRIHPESKTDFTIVTQITTPVLNQGLRLSSKFQRFVGKKNSALMRHGASLQLDEGRLSIVAGLRRGTCTIEDVDLQEHLLRRILWDLRMSEIPKKFRIDPLFVYANG